MWVLVRGIFTSNQFELFRNAHRQFLVLAMGAVAPCSQFDEGRYEAVAFARRHELLRRNLVAGYFEAALLDNPQRNRASPSGR